MKLVSKSILLLFMFIISLTGASSFAQDKLNLSERAKKREGSRWTLSEWLAQKERNKMMDMWLSMNTPSPYEFSLLGAHTNYKKYLTAGQTENTISSFEASAYAKIFGLSAEYEKRDTENENDLSGLFNLRLLGHSIQGTALTLHYGQRTRTMAGATQASIVRNQFYQVSLQIYLSPYFGINGYHRNYLPYTDSYYGDVSGYQNQAGAFIDFEFIRIFGVWFEELQKNSDVNTSEPEIKRNGIKTGLQLFF